LSSPANLYKLKTIDDVALIEADILKQELGTTQNTLSFWKCHSLDHIKNTMKAILLSTSAIKKAQFIVIEDSITKENGLTMDDSEKGKTGYKGYEDLHVNMVDLTYEKIGSVLAVLHEAVKNEEYTPKLNRDQVKEYIVEVKNAGLLDDTALNPDLKKDIEKYFPAVDTCQ
jgi:hypothetical protein